MIQKDISARVPANEKKGTEEMTAAIVVNYTESLEEAKEMFGEEAILTNAFRNWAVTLQSGIRTALKAGHNVEQIQEKFGSAVMGVAQVGTKVDAEQAFIAKFKTATPDKQAEMLQMLKVAAQG
jgi:hypothetical protein